MLAVRPDLSQWLLSIQLRPRRWWSAMTRLKLDTANPETIDLQGESRLFRVTWHHAVAARGGATSVVVGAG